MFYRKLNEIHLILKQIEYNLGRGSAVEEDVADMQEVRGSNPCTNGNL